MVVPGPKLSKDHPDRDIHCQKALETSFLDHDVGKRFRMA